MPLHSNLVVFLDRWAKAKKNLIKTANGLLVYLGVIALFLLIYKLGFKKEEGLDDKIDSLLTFLLNIFFFSMLTRLVLTIHLYNLKKKLLSDFLIVFILFIILSVRVYLSEWISINLPFLNFLKNNIFIYLSIIAVFFAEVSRYSLNLYTINLNPARIFLFSFIFLILVGTGLLLLPTATVNGISVVDALFTSASAVCVTGLVVVDTATHFTSFGKALLLILFQTGGLGIMTFTSFFGFFFQGGFSYQNELFLQSFINEDKMGEIFKSVLKIIFITFGVELIGAAFIYASVNEQLFPSSIDRIEFAIFHSVSAFCNAGFSTLPDGLLHSAFRFNYFLLIIIAFLIIMGGLGFPIVFNFYRYLKYYVKNKWGELIFNKSYVYRPRIINVNTKIVVSTTVILIVGGTFLFLISEWDNALKGLEWNGKLVTAFFGAVTPRTAGFNTVDMTLLAPATILIYIFLMWIGASPGSTGGGIKTSTFAVAVLNTLSIATGKNRLEVFRREIGDESVKRSLAVIFLSLIVIGTSILLITIFDKDKGLMPIAFECFSAFSTVGLTLGITPELSQASKIVIIFTMLIGRVGTLTVIICFFRKVSSLRYNYPKESIFIN